MEKDPLGISLGIPSHPPGLSTTMKKVTPPDHDDGDGDDDDDEHPGRVTPPTQRTQGSNIPCGEPPHSDVTPPKYRSEGENPKSNTPGIEDSKKIR